LKEVLALSAGILKIWFVRSVVDCSSRRRVDCCIWVGRLCRVTSQLCNLEGCVVVVQSTWIRAEDTACLVDGDSIRHLAIE